MMKKTLFTALAAATTLTAFGGVAAAQPYGYDRDARYERDYRDGRYEGRNEDRWERNQIAQRQGEIARRIEAGKRRGVLTSGEAADLYAEARDIVRLQHRFSANGLSRWEWAELDRRLDHLEARVWRQARDDDRAYRYGDGYGRYDRYDRR